MYQSPRLSAKSIDFIRRVVKEDYSCSEISFHSNYTRLFCECYELARALAQEISIEFKTQWKVDLSVEGQQCDEVSFRFNIVERADNPRAVYTLRVDPLGKSFLQVRVLNPIDLHQESSVLNAYLNSAAYKRYFNDGQPLGNTVSARLSAKQIASKDLYDYVAHLARHSKPFVDLLTPQLKLVKAA